MWSAVEIVPLENQADAKGRLNGNAGSLALNASKGSFFGHCRYSPYPHCLVDCYCLNQFGHFHHHYRRY
jgi:hypothetical protein